MKQNILQALPSAQTLQQCQNADEEIFWGGDSPLQTCPLSEGTSPYTSPPRSLRFRRSNPHFQTASDAPDMYSGRTFFNIR